jgi:hypothetical protein
LLLASILWVVLGKRGGRDIPAEESEGRVLLGKAPSIVFTGAVLVVLVAAFYEARAFPYLGAIFPIAATIPAIFMAAAQIVLELRSPREAPGTETRKKIELALGYFLSFVFFLVLILLIGFGIATALFTFAFLYGWVRMRWFTALIYSGVLVGFVVILSGLLGLYWPEGMLFG